MEIVSGAQRGAGSLDVISIMVIMVIMVTMVIMVVPYQ